METNTETQIAELIEQINSLQKAYGRMVDENAEEKRELRTQLAKADERVKELEKELKEAANRFHKEHYDIFKRYEQLRKEQE